VLPWGIRLDVKQEQGAGLEVPCRQTTALAAQLIREGQAPAGVKVLGLFEAYDRCPTVVKACREQRFDVASILKSHRTLWKSSWQLTAGRYGRHLLRRRRPATLILTKPHGSARYRFVEAGGLTVGHLGRLHVVFSRTGTAKKLLGLVTNAPELSAAQLIQTYDRRWTIEIV
jgi:hypothetical protein